MLSCAYGQMQVSASGDRHVLGLARVHVTPAVRLDRATFASHLEVSDAAPLGVLLFGQLRRHLGTTPTQHLRRVRLSRAHHELIAADPRRETVTAVAYRWGLSSPGRFAAFCRQAYGVPPGRTLRS